MATISKYSGFRIFFPFLLVKKKNSLTFKIDYFWNFYSLKNYENFHYSQFDFKELIAL